MLPSACPGRTGTADKDDVFARKHGQTHIEMCDILPPSGGTRKPLLVTCLVSGVKSGYVRLGHGDDNKAHRAANTPRNFLVHTQFVHL